MVLTASVVWLFSHGSLALRIDWIGFSLIVKIWTSNTTIIIQLFRDAKDFLRLPEDFESLIYDSFVYSRNHRVKNEPHCWRKFGSKNHYQRRVVQSPNLRMFCFVHGLEAYWVCLVWAIFLEIQIQFQNLPQWAITQAQTMSTSGNRRIWVFLHTLGNNSDIFSWTNVAMMHRPSNISNHSNLFNFFHSVLT